MKNNISKALAVAGISVASLAIAAPAMAGPAPHISPNVFQYPLHSVTLKAGQCVDVIPDLIVEDGYVTGEHNYLYKKNGKRYDWVKGFTHKSDLLCAKFGAGRFVVSTYTWYQPTRQVTEMVTRTREVTYEVQVPYTVQVEEHYTEMEDREVEVTKYRDVEKTREVTKTRTETYTESEPYTETETYTETVNHPAVTVDWVQQGSADNENGRHFYDFLNEATGETKRLEIDLQANAGQPGLVGAPDGFDLSEKISGRWHVTQTVTAGWDEQVEKTREVTKYRDVEKTREVEYTETETYTESEPYTVVETIQVEVDKTRLVDTTEWRTETRTRTETYQEPVTKTVKVGPVLMDHEVNEFQLTIKK